MNVSGTDPTQTLTATSSKLIRYPDQILMSVVISISELQAFSPVKTVVLSIVGQGKYRLVIDYGQGKKGTWDFDNVTPGAEAFTVTLAGSWTAAESAGATKIRTELLKLRQEYNVTAFNWGTVVVTALPAEEDMVLVEP